MSAARHIVRLLRFFGIFFFLEIPKTVMDIETAQIKDDLNVGGWKCNGFYVK